MTELEKALGDALRDATRQCQRLRYNPTLMIKMIAESGPLDASRRLLDKGEVSEGFTRLWELRRLDLTVEAIALRPEFAPLFTAEQLATARERLAEMGFHVPGHTGPSPCGGADRPKDLSREPSIETANGPVGRNSNSSSTGRGEGVQFAPNRVALTILEQVRERQKDRRETDPSRTQDLIREARAGGMYGHGPTE
jgi:hypothetical protein